MILGIQKLQSNLIWKKNECEDINFDFNSQFNRYIQATKFIDNLESKESDLCKYINLNLKERIGSESQYGEVYNNTIPNSVIKLLPLVNKNSYDMNQNEIDIATRASQLVLERISPHFPIVYDFGFCENFSGFKYKDISSHFLISEKASCDLHTYINWFRKILNFSESLDFKQKEKILSDIKKQCLKAISDMHKYLSVCHNDLHLRNFLVMKNDLNFSNQNILILIHDFGKAEYRENYQELDYEYFEKEFSEAIENL